MNKRDIKKIIGKNNPIIFEIGCADGIDTQEFIDEFGQEIVLHCFEPDPRNASVFTSGGYRPINPNFDLPVSGGTIFLEFKNLRKGRSSFFMKQMTHKL